MVLRGEALAKPSYSILRSLGGGGTGDVHLAEHKIFGRNCVQKTYSTFGLEDAAACQEPRILDRMEHAHVADVTEAQFVDQGGAITFVSRYYEGRCIRYALEDGYRFSILQSLRLATQVLQALSYVAADPGLQLVHRDLKPGNIFTDEDRRNAWLGDFGSAARMDDEGLVDGIEATLLYQPPESGPPDGRMGVTGDIYGLGLTIFEMLNGPFNYETLDRSAEAMDRRVTRGQRSLPESTFVFDPCVPARLRTIVRRAISPDPSRRHQSATEMRDELRRLVSIDWTRTEGVRSLEGTWIGLWPPRLPTRKKRLYKVESTVLRGGKARGMLRFVATQAMSASGDFARFGVDDATLDPADRASADRFFEAVAEKASHLMPAR